MTTKIIFEIAIVFFMVSLSCSSPGRRPDSKGVCNSSVGSMSPPDLRVGRTSKDFIETERAERAETSPRRLTYRICCPGYKNISGTCVPQCSPLCENGYCEEPNICKCHYGLGGKFCNETRLCTISQSIQVEIAETVSDSQVLKSIDGATEDHLLKLKDHACLPECRNEISTTSINFTRSADTIYYFVPIDSPCNTVAADWVFWKEYRYIIGGGMMGIITLIIMIVCTIFIVKKKRRTINTGDTEATENEYAYVDLKQIR